MRHPEETTTMPREELAGLLETMTPHDRQRVTTEMVAPELRVREHEREVVGSSPGLARVRRSLDAYSAHRRAERLAAHPGLVAAAIAAALLAFLWLMVLLPLWIGPPR